MPQFAFQVQERPIAAGEHSWVAVETTSGAEVSLPSGGNRSADKNLAGQYPEIQDFLGQRHGLNVPLVYVPQIDDLNIHPDGTSTWIFRRQAAEVIVYDIPRTVARITTGG